MTAKEEKQLPLFESDVTNTQSYEIRGDASVEQESSFSKYIVYVDESGD